MPAKDMGHRIRNVVIEQQRNYHGHNEAWLSSLRSSRFPLLSLHCRFNVPLVEHRVFSNYLVRRIARFVKSPNDSCRDSSPGDDPSVVRNVAVAFDLSELFAKT